MGSRKGFIHLVEIVIISVVVFVLLSQFANIPGPQANWDREKLGLIGNDILFSLDRTGMNWFDKGAVSAGLSEAFASSSIKYSVTVRNGLRPNVTVGCLCNTTEFSAIQAALSPFRLNNVNVNFTVEQLDPSSPSFPVSDNVMVMGQTAFQSNLSSYASDMNTYLSTGRGIVALGSANPAQSPQSGMFGIANSSAPSSGLLAFSQADSPYVRRIIRLFTSIPSANITATPDYRFANFLQQPALPQRGYTSLLDQGGTGNSASIIGTHLSGRTAWLSAGMDSSGDRMLLLKSVILWAAGDSYDLISADMKNPIPFSLIKIVGSQYSPGMYDPVEIILKLEYAF